MDHCYNCGCSKPTSGEFTLSSPLSFKVFRKYVCRVCDEYQLVCPECQGLALHCPVCDDMLVKGQNNLDLLNDALRQKNEEAAIRVISDFGSKINKVNALGFGVLHIAAMAGNVKAIDVAINFGADVHIKDKNGRTALVNAVWARNGKFNVKIIKSLKNAINDRDLAGMTAIFYAAKGAGLFGSRRGSMKIIKELLANGSKLDVIDNVGLTVLDHAIREFESSKTGQNSDVVYFLQSIMEGQTKM